MHGRVVRAAAGLRNEHDRLHGHRGHPLRIDTGAQLAGGAGCFHQFAKQSQKWRMSNLDLSRM